MKIIAIGELLWDALPDGYQLGGAPLNVAADLKNLGVDAYIISAAGQDDLGRQALNALRDIGLNTDLVQINDQPTGLVQVEIDEDGSPVYEIINSRAWDQIRFNIQIKEAVADADFLVFGTLIFRSEISSSTIRSILGSFKGKCIVDVNFRKPFYSEALVDEVFGFADILKINEEELDEISSWKQIQGNYREVVCALSDLYNLEIVILTRGGQGAVLYLDGVFFEQSAVKVDVVNTVGAGDAFLAGVIYSLINEYSPEKTLGIANKLGAVAASSKGAIPDFDHIDLI